MKKPGKKVEQFEISTSGDFRARLLAQMPEGTVHRRELAGEIGADPGGWFAIDPDYFRPRATEGNPGFPASTEPARVFLELLIAPEQEPVVGAVEVLFGDVAPTRDRKLEANVAIDFGRMMIAGASRIEAGWKVGGPLCGVNLRHDEDFLLERPQSVREVNAAVKELKRAGFKLTEEDQLWHFDGPISEDQILQAALLIRGVSPLVVVNVNKAQSGAELEAQLEEKPFARLEHDGELFAIAFRPGFGNGVYYWDELRVEERVVGYRIRFFDGDVGG